MSAAQELVTVDLAALRRGAKMSKAEVARRLGLPTKTVHRWESGQHWPSVRWVRPLAKLYRVDVGMVVDAIVACGGAGEGE